MNQEPVNPSTASLLQNPNLENAMPADVIAPDNAEQSAYI